jgi:hypothetical protein
MFTMSSNFSNFTIQLHNTTLNYLQKALAKCNKIEFIEHIVYISLY